MTDHSDRELLESMMSADLRALTSEADSIGRVFAERHGVTSSDFYGLLQIMVAESAGRPLSPSGLRQRMGVSGAAITYLVERMVRDGHIRREAHPSDHRKLILRYEPRGLELARSFFSALGTYTRSSIADLSNEDLATAHRVFCALTAGMSEFRNGFATQQPDKKDGDIAPVARPGSQTDGFDAVADRGSTI